MKLTIRRLARRLRGLLVAVVGVIAGCGPDSPSPDELLADVVRMEQESNPNRRQALTEVLSSRGIAFELDPFQIPPRPNYPRTEGANVVVTIGDGPSDIVVGAHYDAVWLGGGNLSRGAVDNAASSIILTRVAEALQSEELGGENFEHRIRIVWFDMEEIGLLGSAHFVDTNDRPIAATINLDVNGYGDTLFYGPAPAGEAENRIHERISEGCADAGLSCLAFGQYPASDYMSFRRAGIPAVSLSVLPMAEAEELRSALNPEPGAAPPTAPPAILALIHTPEDTSAWIDPEGMLISYTAVVNLVRVLDQDLSE